MSVPIGAQALPVCKIDKAVPVPNSEGQADAEGLQAQLSQCLLLVSQ